MSIVRARALEMPEDRTVVAVESGALAGSPLLVFHPTPSSCLFVRQHADAALRTGARLVGFSRPGSGGSTMTTPGLRVVAEDAVRVADAYGLDRFAVLGFSGGTPFAGATAALFPDRVSAVGLCAAVAPWRGLTDRGVEYDDTLATLLAGAETDPAGTLDALRARDQRELAPLLALGDEELATRILEETDAVDRDVLTPELARAQALTLRDALSGEDGEPAFDSPAFDHLAFGTAWDVDVTAVRAPTWVWQGTSDPVTPLAHARWWAGQVPHATLVRREGRGHLGTFEAHREEMLATLRDVG
ncbi:MAG TPA: alpha/beta fold hydrolase [Marmoricola sp.]|nr:alpha/beta fold hydrolase [Marmoricola sp.]